MRRAGGSRPSAFKHRATAPELSVDPSTAIEHEGLRIAFCCNNCRADFQKEPAKFQAMNTAQKRRDDALAALKTAATQYQASYGDPPITDVGARRAVGLPEVPYSAFASA